MWIHEFTQPLATSEGIYRVRVLGEPDGEIWRGWLEFRPEFGGPTLATDRETTQPSLSALEYWASGLEPVYLDGALTRARERAARQAEAVPEAFIAPL